MKSSLRTRLAVETLEDRRCPALNYFFDGSNLTIGDGMLRGAPVGGILTLTQNASDLTVADGASSTTYAVTGNVTVRLNNVAATVNVDLDGNTMPGSLTINTGNGGDTILIGS